MGRPSAAAFSFFCCKLHIDMESFEVLPLLLLSQRLHLKEAGKCWKESHFVRSAGKCCNMLQPGQKDQEKQKCEKDQQEEKNRGFPSVQIFYSRPRAQS